MRNNWSRKDVKAYWKWINEKNNHLETNPQNNPQWQASLAEKKRKLAELEGKNTEISQPKPNNAWILWLSGSLMGLGLISLVTYFKKL